MTTENQEVTTSAAGAAARPAPAAPAAAPAAPAAAPVAPATPAATAVDDGASGVVEYEAIPDDPGLTMALQFVGKQGISPDSPEMQAALKGDFSFLKATLAAKGAGAAGFEHYLALAEKSWEKHVVTSAENHSKTATAIHSAVGGEEQWQAIQKWAGENADPEEKTAINAMLNAGGLQARAAAILLHQMHNAAAGTVVTPANPVAGVTASGGGAAPGTALSPADYAKEVAALTRSMGAHAAGRSPEMETLRQRRSQYRG